MRAGGVQSLDSQDTLSWRQKKSGQGVKDVPSVERTQKKKIGTKQLLQEAIGILVQKSILFFRCSVFKMDRLHKSDSMKTNSVDNKTACGKIIVCKWVPCKFLCFAGGGSAWSEGRGTGAFGAEWGRILPEPKENLQFHKLHGFTHQDCPRMWGRCGD